MDRTHCLFITILVVFVSAAPLWAAENSPSYSAKAERGESLSQISMRLFGTANMWQKIAEWNQLSPPYALKPGQVLALNQKPRLSAERGAEQLLKMWRKKFNPDLYSSIVSQQVQQLQADEAKKESRLQVKAAVESIRNIRAMTEQEVNEVKAEVTKLEEPEFRAAGTLELGRKYFEAKEFEKAVAEFKKCRELDPDLLPAWFYEISSLRALKREDEARAVARELIRLRSELKDSPALKFAQNPGDPK